ncbi:MAG TPA: ribose-5-phosphate isomerase RpiA [Candidatus Binataceae bacterium]|nr:ribose-5-phosphate isomerase RpiA [Candidatus Binataceae bacterium]
MEEKSQSLTYLEPLAQRALKLVKPGTTIGLGTGRTATAFIRALGASGIKIRGVPTSEASHQLAKSLGIELTTLHEVAKLDAVFDGADEVDPDLNMIKGLGGALVREKVVAVASKKHYYLAGDEKLVKRLGEHGNLPVEVIPFASAFAIREIKQLGLEAKIRKTKDGSEYISDNGNLVLDCKIGTIRNPGKLDRQIETIPGVLGTGLFVGIADMVLVASQNGKVKTLKRRD